jgi:hypothetical protein
MQPPTFVAIIGERALAPNATSGLSMSLRTLFLATFVSACFSRWLAEYGVGLAVPFGWTLAIGGIIGTTFGLVSCIASYVSGRAQGKIEFHLREVAFGAICGGIAGFFWAAIAFALWRAVSSEGTFHVAANGTSVVAFIDHRRRPPFLSDVSAALRAIVITGSVLGAFANSLAWLVRAWRPNSLLYVTTVAGVNALLMGPVPVIVLLVALNRLPPPRSPLEYEWLGLWPLAALIYSIAFAGIGAVTGALAAGYWLWESYARSGRTASIVFWLLVLYCIAFISQLGLPL